MKFRFWTLIGFLGSVYAVWIIYLFAVQVLDVHGLRRMQPRRYTLQQRLVVPNRGNITDRNGNLLVGTLRFFQIDFDREGLMKASKNQKRDYDEMLERVAVILADETGKPLHKVRTILNQKGGRSVLIDRQIREAQLTAIQTRMKEEKLEGLVSTFSCLKRSYPHERLAGRLLGMTRAGSRIDPDTGLEGYTLQGVRGIEATFDSLLQGDFGLMQSYFDANNKRIPDPSVEDIPAQNGHTLVLTIDHQYQQILERNLTEGIRDFNAKNAIGVIMDPRNGEVLAMSGISRSDLHHQPGRIRSMPNLPVSFIFEPGSTMKTFPTLLALENNLFSPDELINCRSYHYKSRKIRDSHHHDSLNLRYVLAYSSNVGISRVADAVGPERLYTRLHELGFGQRLAHQFHGQNRGIFRDLDNWNGYSLHSISFGQEIAVNALQMATAFSAVANGGQVMEPHIALEVRDANDRIVDIFSPKIIRRIGNPAAIDSLKSYLQSVVDDGTATACQIDRLPVAGKTGTAEKMKSGGGGYAEYLYSSSFIGFFPVNDPRLLMLILFDEPDYRYHFASVSAVPVFKQVSEEILHLPTCALLMEERQKAEKFVTMPDILGKDLETAARILKQKGIAFNLQEITPEGHVINQFPKAGVSFSAGQKATVIIDLPHEKALPSDHSMPKLTGLTLRRALETARRHNLRLSVEGHGIVIKQSIPPGSSYEYEETCFVRAN